MKTAQKEYMRKYILAKYHRRRVEYIAALGNKCAACGSMDDLTFDHIDPEQKSFNIGQKLNGATKEELDAEIFDKCQLLCKECHDEKNKADNGEAQHGSLAMYSHHRCRCEECRSVWNKHSRDYRREYRRKKDKSSVLKFKGETMRL
jgi:hypothetical protein